MSFPHNSIARAQREFTIAKEIEQAIDMLAEARKHFDYNTARRIVSSLKKSPTPKFWAKTFTQSYTDFNDPAHPVIEYTSLMLFGIDNRFNGVGDGHFYFFCNANDSLETAVLAAKIEAAA